MIKIALVQAPACLDCAVNLQVIAQYTAQAAQEGCSVICFPECFLTGYLPEEVQTRAVASSSPLLSQISQLAVTHHIDLLMGYMEQAHDRYFITHGLFRKDGSTDHYRKTHPGRRELDFFTPGDRLEPLTLTDGTNIGIQLCVETHYPEITQTLALRGAEVIFAPHAVPRVSGDRAAIWGKYIPARSYDNRVYMACCNIWDETRYGGGCLVTGPRGETVASCFSDEPTLLICTLDRGLLASFRDPHAGRSRHFYPALRRKELFE